MSVIMGCIVVVVGAGLAGDLVDEVGGLLLDCLDGGGLGVVVGGWVGHFCGELIGEMKVVFDNEFGKLPFLSTFLGTDTESAILQSMDPLVLFATKINVLLIFIPLGIIAHFLKWPEVAIFLLNFVAIIPLAKLLGYATEEIALRLGENLGALLNASFGNAVELIMAVIALKEGEIEVVKASVLGSVLSNLLLVMGFCFVCGGVKYKVQNFNQTAAQTSASLLALSCLSLLIPAAFSATSSLVTEADLDHLSYGTAIVLLVVYVLYLFFQLKTHTYLYSTSNDEEEEPQLPLWFGVFLLLGITAIVAICAEFLVDSIGGLAESWNLSRTFIGLILLPIVGNAAEHVTAVTVAMKNKMDLAIGVAIGSSMQIALFVTPLLVIVGWILVAAGTLGAGHHMNLLFNTFETCVMFVSVLIVNYLIQDGESNWLEGVMLLSTYIIIAIAVYFYPETQGVPSAGH
ncbi:MAG: Sodium/calcium exchanger protein-domain-containing protein [Podila humilis]|nr:MAG: Sodium/calcium exchanger protein-domain-containing protein [Podila humilis]